MISYKAIFTVYWKSEQGEHLFGDKEYASCFYMLSNKYLRLNLEA
jgi:hypothetical protein